MDSVAANKVLQTLSTDSCLLHAKDTGKCSIGEVVSLVRDDSATRPSFIRELLIKENAVSSSSALLPTVLHKKPNQLATCDSHLGVCYALPAPAS